MSELTLQEAAAVARRLNDAVSAVIRGADSALRLITCALLCGGHVLIEDLPGTGKTTLAKALAAAAGCDVRRVQCTPDLMPADITGFEILTQKPDEASGTATREMVFRKGPVFTNILLADEINRMAPRSQAGLLECMEERQVTAGGTTYPLPAPFLVIATQNPIELQGTFPLPEAQLDRFLMRLSMGTPPREAEREILRGRQTADPLDSVTAVTSPAEILAAQKAVRTVRTSDAVLDYILDLADASRKHGKLRCGLSTRAVLALRHAAQANAVTEGRDCLTPDDVKSVFPAVCAHRFSVSGALSGDSAAGLALAEELLSAVPVAKS